MDTASPLPISLTLHPLLPARAPEPGGTDLTFGFQLRLAGGPGLLGKDPLLAAVGANVVRLAAPPDHEEALQDDAFDPGRRLSLRAQGVDDDSDVLIAVWDADGTRQAGFLPYPVSATVAAALDRGLSVEGIVLAEGRALLDDRRLGIELLVHATELVRVDHDPALAIARPQRPARTRVVLLADGTSELRWWDPTGAAGPMAIGDLPVSAELTSELQRLSSELVRAAADDEAPEDFVEGIERDYARSALQARTRELWHRTRRELGQRYAIGLLAPGMTRPAWSADELEEEPDPDIAF